MRRPRPRGLAALVTVDEFPAVIAGVREGRSRPRVQTRTGAVVAPREVLVHGIHDLDAVGGEYARFATSADAGLAVPGCSGVGYGYGYGYGKKGFDDAQRNVTPDSPETTAGGHVITAAGQGGPEPVTLSTTGAPAGGSRTPPATYPSTVEATGADGRSGTAALALTATRSEALALRAA